jgi:hypothetical protein
MNMNDSERRLGLSLGYPACCVDSFVAGRWWLHVNADLKTAVRHSPGPQGFVPCEACCRRIASGEISKADLIGRVRNVSKAEFRRLVLESERSK